MIKTSIGRMKTCKSPWRCFNPSNGFPIFSAIIPGNRSGEKRRTTGKDRDCFHSYCIQEAMYWIRNTYFNHVFLSCMCFTSVFENGAQDVCTMVRNNSQDTSRSHCFRESMKVVWVMSIEKAILGLEVSDVDTTILLNLRNNSEGWFSTEDSFNVLLSRLFWL